MANTDEARVYGWTPQNLGASAGQSGYAQPGKAVAATTVSSAEQASSGAPGPVAGNVTEALTNPGYASAGIQVGSNGQVLGVVSGGPAFTSSGGGGGISLTPTAVKTSAYTAVAGDFIPVDTTSGSVTITLPTAPADLTVIGIKMVTQGSTNTVTYAAGGSDVFNKTGGATSGTLTLLSQGVILQYKASGAIWYVFADDLPLSQLDLRYLKLSGGTMSGAIAMGSNKITGLTNGSGAQDAAAFGQTVGGGNLTPMTTAGDLLIANATPAPARLAIGTQSGATGQFLGISGGLPAWQVMSGQYLCTPTQYAPASRVILTTSSSTMAPVSGAASTVAAGSNGGEISTIATWGGTYGGNGVLDVASGTVFPTQGGTVNVAASGATTAVVTYTGVSGNTLTGCAYVSGSPAGTVSTGGAVTLTSAAASTGSFTAPASGSVVVTVSMLWSVATSADTGAFALAAHGTVTPLVSNVIGSQTNTQDNFITLPFLVTGLTPGTSYNFDLMCSSPSSVNVNVITQGQTTTTPSTSTSAPVTMTVQAV